MGGRKALLLCPDAVVVPPRFDAYTTASKAVFAIFEDTTPLVEPVSIDEAFLDVGGLGRVSGTPVDIATRLRTRVLADVGLAITVGIARTKFLAKVASRTAKPDGLLEVPPQHELDFLHPLPVDRLWGVGPKTAAKLAERGLRTVADVAGVGEPGLVALLGLAVGRQLNALAMNTDPRQVRTGRRRGSIGSQHATGIHRRGIGDLAAVEDDLTAIVDRVSRRMRKAHRVGRTVVLRMRFGDYTRATRSRTLPQATCGTTEILAAARGLLRSAEPLIRDKGLTMIGLSVSGLSADDAIQLALPVRRARPRRAGCRPRSGQGAVRQRRGEPGRAAGSGQRGLPRPEPPGLTAGRASGLVGGFSRASVPPDPGSSSGGEQEHGSSDQQSHCSGEESICGESGVRD